MKRVILAWLFVAACAQAAPLALPPTPQAGFVQRPGARLPLSTTFTDDSGKAVRLAQYFNDRPVLLVLGYYQCPNLCSTLMEGVVQMAAAMDLPRSAYRLIEVSIDPNETVTLAARKKASYQPMLGRRGGELHLLTGGQAAIDRLTASAGFRYAYDRQTQQYAHPAGLLIATPDGRIARYFMGVRFDPRQVRLALVDASSGRIGSVSDRLWLLCAHFDPASGRYSIAAMTAVRIACMAVLAMLVVWMLRQRRQR